MPDWITWLIIGIYGIAMLFIFAYSIVQLRLLVNYRKSLKSQTNAPPLQKELPSILVQLPVYNELYVVERLIDAATQLDYPHEKLEIQLLDDSSDESFEIAQERVAFWQKSGINIRQIKRPVRTGFKAGALQYGMDDSDSDLVAIFDADFIPSTDFLLKTIAYFQNPEIGMVQTRWGHLNRNYSLLTRVQAFALDAHFTVEQTGRNAAFHFINFNGTAGIWRRECILDAGGWSADTLTEDLDLSYRAQLKGWKFKFLENICSPAELPAEMNALKNQQYRWNKGAAECASKHLGNVLKNGKLTLSTRTHALFHLLNSSVFIWILTCAILSFPLVLIKIAHPELKTMFYIGSILLISFGILAAFYFTSYKNVDNERKSIDFFWLYPAFLSVSMGMSLHNTRAVLQGYFGKKTPFIRTPKWNLVGRSGSWGTKQYLDYRISIYSLLEGILAIYFLGALIYEINVGEWGFVLLHFMLLFGFSFVFFMSVKHSLLKIDGSK